MRQLPADDELHIIEAMTLTSREYNERNKASLDRIFSIVLMFYVVAIGNHELWLGFCEDLMCPYRSQSLLSISLMHN